MDNYAKLFEYYLVAFNYINYKTLKHFTDKEYDIEEVFEYLYSACCEDNEELDLSKEESKEVLFEFINKYLRYNLLNDNMNEAYDNLTDNGKEEYLIEHLQEIIELSEKSFKEAKQFPKVDLQNMPELSHEELDRLFKQFLLKMDGNGDYLKEYIEMKRNNRIIYLDNYTPEKREYIKQYFRVTRKDLINFFYKNTTGYGVIFIDRKGTINDLSILAHEFMHYYTFVHNKDKNPSNLLLEFPSIFYENLANNFLLSKGYDKEAINRLSLFRQEHIKSISYYLTGVLHYLEMYEKGKKITKEMDMLSFTKGIYEYMERVGYQQYLEKKQEKPDDFDPYKLSDIYSDDANIALTIDPKILSESISYIIGCHLAKRYLLKYFNKEFTKREMKQITTNLPNINVKEIFDAINEKPKMKIKTNEE